MISDEEAVRTVQAALEHGGRPHLAVDVVFVDDPTLAAMHERFLGDPSPTDVIAFELGPQGEGPEAEIYVSLDRAREVGRRRAVEARREAALYLVHGALHLCGHDDHEEEDRQRMRVAEARVLAGLGHTPDDAAHQLGAEFEST